MYKLLLTFRYLRRKLIPWFALAAVTLCTAMVIIVMSVMGGFLDLVREAGHSLVGDVTMQRGVSGFPHYQMILDEMRKLPEAEAATPIVIGYGIANLPGDWKVPVEVIGIDGPGQQRVTGYAGMLYWNTQRLRDEDLTANIPPGESFDDASLHLRNPWAENLPGPAIVPGLEISPYNQRKDDGTYSMAFPMLTTQWTLTVQPITAKGGIDTLSAETEIFVVVNEFKSGLYEADSRRVFIPFDVAQRMMWMDAGEPDPNDPEFVPAPARCTEIQIRAAEGYTPDELRAAVSGLYRQLADQNEQLPRAWDMSIKTWIERQSTLINAVENEKGLLTVLFAIISGVAVVMVGVIFYMIVLQKTRDIGVLRAIGASRPGVASIFLVYGAAIGLIGAGVGTLIAHLFVHYINPIHEWLGNGFGGVCFNFGLPLGVGALFAMIGLVYVAVETLCDQTRVRNWLAVVGVGLGLGAAVWLLAIGWMYLWPEAYLGFHRAAERTHPGLWVINLVLMTLIWAAVGAVVLGLIGGLHALIDRQIRTATWVKLVATGAVGVALALLTRLALSANLKADWLTVAWWNEQLSIQIWDRRVYFFEQIPSRMEWREVLVVVIIAVIASIAGALIPAIQAGRVDPVESLRYE